MALNSVETIKSCVSGETERSTSKTSFGSKKTSETASRVPKSLKGKHQKARPKTADGVNRSIRSKTQTSRPLSAEPQLNLAKIPSDIKGQEEKQNAKSIGKPKQPPRDSPGAQRSKKTLTFTKVSQKNSSSGNGKPPKESPKRKPSEIPKLKALTEASSPKYSPKTSKVSIATKVTTLKHTDSGTKGKQVKEDTEDVKARNATKENFSTLIPLCENELKKMTDSWMNSVYCSLSSRTNLVKLLFQEFPQIDRSQFHEEDDILEQYLSRAKSSNKTEEKNLMQLVQSLVGNRNKIREKYCNVTENKEIAKTFNHNWRTLTKKIADLEDEAKQLQEEIPQLEKKKADVQEMAKSKIHAMESALNKKEEEIRRLIHELNILKHRQSSYKGNVLMKVEEYKDIKAEAASLSNVEKEFEDMKAKYSHQKEVFEKKIEELETMLEEKKKILEREQLRKRQLQGFLTSLQNQQKNLYRSIGKEQVDYIIGRTSEAKNKRRELLWMSAIKLVMRGFLLQMRRLEKERNKMLLELNSYDLESFNNVSAAVLQKEIFMKSIRQQMNSLQRAQR